MQYEYTDDCISATYADHRLTNFILCRVVICIVGCYTRRHMEFVGTIYHNQSGYGSLNSYGLRNRNNFLYPLNRVFKIGNYNCSCVYMQQCNRRINNCKNWVHC